MDNLPRLLFRLMTVFLLVPYVSCFHVHDMADSRMGGLGGRFLPLTESRVWPSKSKLKIVTRWKFADISHMQSYC